MTNIEPSLVETLLNMPESHVLDFKQAQYPLAGATDEQKGELVKDILAFANAWKTADAHIFIGAAENAGQRAIVTGASPHLNDADVQQLVNGKTNVAVDFEYVPTMADGKPVAIIRIAKEQRRPVFLLKQFGRLKANAVYFRRGSSTAEADPAEIARMGAAVVTAAESSVLEVLLADPEERKVFGAAALLRSRVLVDPPPPDSELVALRERITGESLQAAMAIRAAIAMDRPKPEQVAKYREEMAILSRVGFQVRNVGQVLAKDVRIQMEIPKAEGLVVTDELPRRPRDPREPFAFSVPASFGRGTEVFDRGAVWEVVARFKKVQTSATSWSDPFWIGARHPTSLNLVAYVYADTLRQRIEVPLQTTIEIETRTLDIDGYENDDH